MFVHGDKEAVYHEGRLNLFVYYKYKVQPWSPSGILMFHQRVDHSFET